MSSTTPGVRNATQDVTAILTANTFRPLFQGAHIMRATVRESSKYTQFKIEDGAVRSDHRFFNPIEIDLSLLLTDEVRDLYEQLRQAYLDGQELIIQTRVGSYTEQFIQEIPYDSIPEQGESIPIVIKLLQVQTTEAEYGALPARSVANKSQSSTVQKGNQQTTESDAAKRRKASVLYGVLN